MTLIKPTAIKYKNYKVLIKPIIIHGMETYRSYIFEDDTKLLPVMVQNAFSERAAIYQAKFKINEMIKAPKPITDDVDFEISAKSK